jgi:hypothetical protein
MRKSQAAGGRCGAVDTKYGLKHKKESGDLLKVLQRMVHASSRL